MGNYNFKAEIMDAITFDNYKKINLIEHAECCNKQNMIS